MSDVEGRIVDAIVRDLSDRSGLGNAWEQIDADVQAEIRAAWSELVRPVWQPIATAPRDSSSILVHRQGVWLAPIVVMWANQGAGGWWLDAWGRVREPSEPTHWMPIPRLPLVPV